MSGGAWTAGGGAWRRRDGDGGRRGKAVPAAALAGSLPRTPWRARPHPPAPVGVPACTSLCPTRRAAPARGGSGAESGRLTNSPACLSPPVAPVFRRAAETKEMWFKSTLLATGLIIGPFTAFVLFKELTHPEHAHGTVYSHM